MINKTRKLRIALYSPYLHIMGGGERYLLSIAEVLSKKHQVFLFGNESIREKARSFFDISLDRVQFLPSNVFRTKNLLKKYISLFYFNIFFFMTDGSLFFSPVPKNFLIIQSPAHTPCLSFLNKIKLRKWKILCYSKFMQKIISQRLKQRSFILPPAIDIKNQCHPELACLRRQVSGSHGMPNPPARLPDGTWPAGGRHDNKKKNIILTVGRFFPFPHNKKQDFLLSVFKKYYQKYFSGWKLVIAGGLTEKGGKNLVEKLRRESTDLPVEILVDVPYSELTDLYNQAKIYWHAAGFGEDLKKFPERAEHFGITTLEAMAKGTVPVVYNAGGQSEIVEEAKSGYRWHTEEELVEKSVKLIKDKLWLSDLAKGAKKRALGFSNEKFYEKLEKVINL